MRLATTFRRGILLACVLAALPFGAAADENTPQPQSLTFDSTGAVLFYQRAQASVQDTLDHAMALLGIPYRRGGNSPESGFDCSGFVSHVFRETIGLILPRSSRDLSKSGDSVGRSELQPGDLVFFNTMRRAFSHVGIYLGNGQFIHAPRSGGRVRVEDMNDNYWNKRYNGARRVEAKAEQ
jgi:cell wall-associated NlpC family hydrolase